MEPDDIQRWALEDGQSPSDHIGKRAKRESSSEEIRSLDLFAGNRDSRNPAAFTNVYENPIAHSSPPVAPHAGTAAAKVGNRPGQDLASEPTKR